MAEAAKFEHGIPGIDGIDYELGHESYAQALTEVRRLGHLAISGQLDSFEGQRVQTLDFANFTTAIEENIKTDPEFRHHLDVTSKQSFAMQGGTARDASGTPLVEVIARGVALSTAKVEEDSRMHFQSVRDAGDLLNAQAVDAMAPGTARIVVSMDPKHALENEPKFTQALGYRKGIAYLQWYYKDETTVTAGALSIDHSDLARWRATLAESGLVIPADATPDTWIQSGLHVAADAATTAELLALTMRESYYTRCGTATHRYSVTEYVARHGPLLDVIYAERYLPICIATASGHKNKVVHDFATALLQQSANFKPELRDQLIQICNRQEFDAADARLLCSLLRYAVVEELRQGLTAFISPSAQPIRRNLHDSEATIAHAQYMHISQLDQRLAENSDRGSRARRSYGGCGGTFTPGEHNQETSLDTVGNPQDSYGGAAQTDSSSETIGGVCIYQHNGCYCSPYDDDGKKLSTNKTVSALRDSAGTAHCLRRGCGAAIDKYSKQLSRSRIADKATKLSKLTSRLTAV